MLWEMSVGFAGACFFLVLLLVLEWLLTALVGTRFHYEAGELAKLGVYFAFAVGSVLVLWLIPLNFIGIGSFFVLAFFNGAGVLAIGPDVISEFFQRKRPRDNR